MFEIPFNQSINYHILPKAIRRHNNQISHNSIVISNYTKFKNGYR